MGFILESQSRLTLNHYTVSRAPGSPLDKRGRGTLAELCNHRTIMYCVSTVCLYDGGHRVVSSPTHPLTSGMRSGGNELEALTFTARVRGWERSTNEGNPKASPGHQTLKSTRRRTLEGTVDSSFQQKKRKPLISVKVLEESSTTL